MLTLEQFIKLLMEQYPVRYSYVDSVVKQMIKQHPIRALYYDTPYVRRLKRVIINRRLRGAFVHTHKGRRLRGHAFKAAVLTPHTVYAPQPTRKDRLK